MEAEINRWNQRVAPAIYPFNRQIIKLEFSLTWLLVVKND